MQWPETQRCCIINGFLIAALGHDIRKVQKTGMDSNWMQQSNFWPMLMMLIPWAKKYLL